MIDYETYCRIKTLHCEHGLSTTQIADKLQLDPKTVKKWIAKERYEKPNRSKPDSKLEPYKESIKKLIEKFDYTGRQLFQMIGKEGYDGGYTILTDYLRLVRPSRKKPYLDLVFAPGECAQVDFGQWGTIQVGETRRKLSFFVMTLSYSRMTYVEFILKETMEFWLDCHRRAFEFFGGVPEKIMVDRCKVAIIKDVPYSEPIPNPRYKDFSEYYGFKIKACAKAAGNEKGRVENGVKYVKMNFLRGLEISILDGLNELAAEWRDQIANVRIHQQTKKRPIDMFVLEKKALKSLPAMPYDCSIVVSAKRASNQCLVSFDSNKYSVPHAYASTNGIYLKVSPKNVAIYYRDSLIASHRRCFGRNCKIINEDHVKQLYAYKKNAKEQKMVRDFLALTPEAEEYYAGLAQRRMNAKFHICKIIALAQIYDPKEVARAIKDALYFHAFSSEYILNLLEQRRNTPTQPSPLHLTRKSDLLELEIEPPNIQIYNLNSEKKEEDEDEEREQS